MPTADLIHSAVKKALEKDGWTVTDDPLFLKYEGLKMYVDLAAERPLAAERQGQRIAVEVKSFLGPSPVDDLKNALGQYQIYLSFLEQLDPERKLYLAVGDTVYDDFFERKAVQMIVKRFDVSLLVVDLRAQEVSRWIR